jgi:hypothetical protein
VLLILVVVVAVAVMTLLVKLGCVVLVVEQFLDALVFQLALLVSVVKIVPCSLNGQRSVNTSLIVKPKRGILIQQMTIWLFLPCIKTAVHIGVQDVHVLVEYIGLVLFVMI